MENVVIFFVYALCGGVGLASLDILGLRVLSGIPIGEDFYRGGQGYMEYIHYWKHVGKVACIGATLGLVAYAIT